MSFNPESCGSDSWRWMEFVEDVILHDCVDGVSKAQYPAKLLVGADAKAERSFGRTALVPGEVRVSLWVLNSAAAPKIDWVVDRPGSGTQLVIKNVDTPRIGPFTLTLVEGRKNE
jgi:hypothetical protein